MQPMQSKNCTGESFWKILKHDFKDHYGLFSKTIVGVVCASDMFIKKYKMYIDIQSLNWFDWSSGTFGFFPKLLQQTFPDSWF